MYLLVDFSISLKLSTLSPLIQKEVSDYIEFLIQKQQAPEKQRIHPKAGCMKGVFHMASDFNTDLEDFKEYMQ